MSIQRSSHPALFVVILLVVLSGAAQAASKKPTTVAELASCQGTDRQQILNK